MIFSTLLMVLAMSAVNSLPAGEESRGRNGWVEKNYYFPYTCTLTSFTWKVFVSTCSIVSERYMISSSDNMFLTTTESNGVARPMYFNPSQMRAWGGTMFMSPHKATIEEDYRQMGHVYRLHFAKYSAWADGFKDGRFLQNQTYYRVDPYDSRIISSRMEWNVVGGLEIGTCIVELIPSHKWKWSPYVLPIPVYTTDYSQMARDSMKFLDTLERFYPNMQHSCYTTAWNSATKSLIVRRQIFVPRLNCREMWCRHEPRSCSATAYPKKDYEVCFTSDTSLNGCNEDRGGALYCPFFNKSIFAILTNAPTCGVSMLPNVYTLLPIPMKIYERTGSQYSAVNVQRYRISPPPSAVTHPPGFEDF